MPRQLKEIRNFNIGNIYNADDREVADEAASFSRGIDSNAPNGILRGVSQDRYKGASGNYAKYKIDTGIVVTTAFNNVSSSMILSDVSSLAKGDWISIGAYAWQITGVNSATKTVSTSTNRYGTFDVGSPVEIAVDSVVYKIPTPMQLVSYVKDVNEDIENVIIFDQEGSINGIEDIQTNESGTLGGGINTTLVSDDFTNFPFSVNHTDTISAVRKGASYYIGTGPGTKSKWMGKVGDLALKAKKGFILEDAELLSPDFGGGNSSYDKIITYQYTTTNSSTATAKLPLIDNETGVFHVAFTKGDNYIYIIDGDSGFVNRSINIGFSITAIAKVVSCKTDARIWLYEEIDDLTKFATNPGKIHCYEIFDFQDTNPINLRSNAEFPIGVPLTFQHEHDCHWGQDHNSGYPSEPIYNGGLHSDTSGADYPNPIPEVSDILETVDSSGNGKLWILASPQGRSERNEWFRTANMLEEEQMLLHRFIWCSYSNIDGDLQDGTTVTTYFNDKSMPMSHINDMATARNVLQYRVGNANHTDVGHTNFFKLAGRSSSTSGQAGDSASANFYMSTMKRSVPGASGGYTEPAKPESSGLQSSSNHLIFETATNFDDGEERYFSLVHGGSYWYSTPWNNQTWTQTTPGAPTDNVCAKLTLQYDFTDCETENNKGGHNYTESFINNTHRDYYKLSGENRWGNFKPMPYSLVDLSDLYDGVDHVVGCVVKISDTTSPVFLEDMWMTHHDNATADTLPDHEVTKGLRLIGMGGKSFLWITNADIANYGAHYVRSNSFGYIATGSNIGNDANHLDDIPLSTLGFDKNDKIVRQIKVLGDSIPSSGITSIARNTSLSPYNGFQTYNDRDSRFSGLFITYNPLDDDGNSVGSVKGLTVRLNTTTEQADTIDNITNAHGNEVTIIGDAEAGLAGYANHAGTSGSGFIIGNTSGTDADETNTINQNAIIQSNGGGSSQDVTNNTSLTVEALASHAGLHSGTPEAPNEVLPNGPGVISYFDTNGFFRKVWYNGSSATTVSNLFTEAEHAIPDNRAIILRSESLQKGFIIGSGPYESNDNPDNFPVNGTITKYGYINPAQTQLDMTPTNVDPLDTGQSTIAYVWPKGTAALNDGTGASDEGRRSQYKTSDYYFTIFNKGGKNNMYYGSLTSAFAGVSAGKLDSFGDNVAGNDFFSRFFINRLYQYTKKTSVEFENGEAHVDDTDDEFLINFPTETSRYYKLSYEYDGFQDSPLTTSTYVYTNSSSSNKFKNIKIKIRIPFNLSSRISAILVWRRGLIESDTVGEAYRKVARLKLQTGAGWTKIDNASGEYYEKEIVDGFDGSNETYKQWSDISETVVNTNVNYTISCSGGNKLYVAGLRHSLLPEGNNSLAWSKEGKYSQFDIQNDRMDLDDDITALKYYNGVLLVFSLNKIYKIDVNSNQIIDEIQGFGCLNNDCVAETEYGLFFADRNHIYKYTGTSVEVISYPVDTGDDKSWTSICSNLTNIKIYFSSKLNLLIIVSTLSSSTTNILTYHVLKQRWDYRFVTIKNASNTFDAQNLENSLLLISKLGGDIYAFTGLQGKGDLGADASSKLVEIEGSSDYGQITWTSKDFTLGQDTNDKRFKKIKIEANAALSSAPTVKVDGSTCTLVSAGTNEWKITTNKKGKKISVAIAGNDEKEIYSIGIIYRTMKVR